MMRARGVKMFKRKVIILVVLALMAQSVWAQNATATGLAPVRQYIAGGWDTLTRSMTDCAFVVDPKMKVHPVLYLPAGFPVPPAVEKLHADCGVEIEHLPKPIQHLGEIDT